MKRHQEFVKHQERTNIKPKQAGAMELCVGCCFSYLKFCSHEIIIFFKEEKKKEL